LTSPKTGEAGKAGYPVSPATKQVNIVLPDLIRQPVSTWIPAFAGMTAISVSLPKEYP